MTKSMVSMMFLFLLILSGTAFAADTISPREAIKHIGKQATVCGTVVSTHFSSQAKGQPTFLNLDKPFPHHVFTAVILSSDRSKFHNTPEKYYRNKKICVSGLIEQYKGIPEIIVKFPGQMKEK